MDRYKGRLVVADGDMTIRVRSVSMFALMPHQESKAGSIFSRNARVFATRQRDICDAGADHGDVTALADCNTTSVAAELSEFGSGRLEKAYFATMKAGRINSHRFSPIRDLRRKALVKRFATVHLVYQRYYPCL